MRADSGSNTLRPRRLKLAHKESAVQAAFITWTRHAEARYPALRLAFSVPNGAWTRNYAMAMKLKREGMRKGVPDWMLPVSLRDDFGNVLGSVGLAIEFKRKGAKPTVEQLEYHSLLRDQGWRVEVCDDWQKAREIVQEYLSI